MREYTDLLTIFWGLIFIIIPLIYIIVPYSQSKTIEAFKNPSVRWTSAGILFLVGMFHVLNHNLWTSGIELFITILGWIVLIKSIVLAFSLQVVTFSNRVMKSKVFSFILMAYIVVGLYLLSRYFGYNLI
jgi:hypothetical protein